jgi:hypothetical protein
MVYYKIIVMGWFPLSIKNLLGRQIELWKLKQVWSSTEKNHIFEDSDILTLKAKGQTVMILQFSMSSFNNGTNSYDFAVFHGRA